MIHTTPFSLPQFSCFFSYTRQLSVKVSSANGLLLDIIDRIDRVENAFPTTWGLYAIKGGHKAGKMYCLHWRLKSTQMVPWVLYLGKPSARTVNNLHLTYLVNTWNTWRVCTITAPFTNGSNTVVTLIQMSYTSYMRYNLGISTRRIIVWRLRSLFSHISSRMRDSVHFQLYDESIIT